MLGRVWKLGALAVAGVAFCLGNPLAAKAVVSDVLVINGQAVVSPSVQISGGAGSFTFNTSVCAGVSDGDGVAAPTPEAGLCVIASTGTYANIVCGTGSATGTATISGAESATASFSITFAGTIGVVTGSVTDNPPDSDTVDAITGVVQIGPPVPPSVPPVGTCTNGFTVTGALGATDSDIP
jgi:hypothetical protein